VFTEREKINAFVHICKYVCMYRCARPFQSIGTAAGESCILGITSLSLNIASMSIAD
jgi:hypothetical protein